MHVWTLVESLLREEVDETGCEVGDMYSSEAGV